MSASRPFISGLELSRQLFQSAIRPVLAESFPGLPYASALIGRGSETLGYDTDRSMDHDWGPRLLIMTAESMPLETHERIRRVIGDA